MCWKWLKKKDELLARMAQLGLRLVDGEGIRRHDDG